MATKKSTGVPAALPSLPVGGGRVLQLVPRVAQPQLSEDQMAVIGALEELLCDARAGKIDSFLWASKFGEHHHGIGLAGDYRENPAQVLTVTSRIEYRVNQLLDGEFESILEPETNR